MGYLLKTNIPLSAFLCHSCSTTTMDSHRDNNAAAYIRYDVPIVVDSQQLTVSLDVKKITWRKFNTGAYLAYSEMYVECPLCNLRHNILSKIEAPKILLENSMNCDICGSNLSLTEENIELEDEDGRERLRIKGTLICKNCGEITQLKYFQAADAILSDDITLLAIHSKSNAIRRITPMKFKVGVTFTGTHRSRVNSIVNNLLDCGFSKDDIFYDEWHDALINGIDADIELRNIYADHCDCVVVFLSKDYNTRSWTRGVEWRAVRKIINTINSKKICLLNVDGVDINEIDGLSSFTDIAKKIEALSDEDVVEFIKKRYELTTNNTTIEGQIPTLAENDFKNIN